MSDQQETHERADLKRINEQLKASLARCRFMLADARAKLAANSNEQDRRRERRTAKRKRAERDTTDALDAAAAKKLWVNTPQKIPDSRVQPT